MNYVKEAEARLKAALPGLPGDLLEFYTLLVLVRGTACTLEDVHDAWAVWRSFTQPEHESLIPFAELTAEVQELDRLYMDGIHEAASIVKNI